jgi:predicted DNA-binding mobile mystery protein A
MRKQFRELRVHQLMEIMALFPSGGVVVRPKSGWLKAIRQSLGLSLEFVGHRANTKKAGLRFLEQSEAQDRITIGSLKRVANAMECELVYAIVPKTGTLDELAQKCLSTTESAIERAVLHTMTLENQTPQKFKERAKDQTVKSGKK